MARPTELSRIIAFCLVAFMLFIIYEYIIAPNVENEKNGFATITFANIEKEADEVKRPISTPNNENTSTQKNESVVSSQHDKYTNATSILTEVPVKITDPKKNKTLTFVTALYTIPNKRGLNQGAKPTGMKDYYDWFGNLVALLTLDVPIVIFVNDTVMEERLKEINPEKTKKFKFIIFPLIDTLTYNLLTDKEWAQQVEMDFEKSYHNKWLYVIWFAKIELLVRSMNYFETDYYMWMDAGYIRSPVPPGLRFPQVEIIEKHCTTAVCMNLLNKHVYYISKDEPYQFLPNNSICSWYVHSFHVGGGFIGGKRDNLIWFLENLHKTILDLKKQMFFIGKDQNVYAWMFTRNKERFQFFCPAVGTSNWLFADLLFSGRQESPLDCTNSAIHNIGPEYLRGTLPQCKAIIANYRP